uniref:Uncharacterized protein n=1 Tax=Anguilla anguilla TaxID=7936 RepID=A0A0E9XMC3_ANGAN
MLFQLTRNRIPLNSSLCYMSEQWLKKKECIKTLDKTVSKKSAAQDT